MRLRDIAGIPFVCSWSGGKDSCLALHRAVAAGGVLARLLCLVREDGTATLGHGLPVDLVRGQAERLGCDLELCPTSWHDYQPRWTAALARQAGDGIAAAVFGDVYRADHRRLEDGACRGSGLRPIWPLWRQASRKLAAEMVATGTRALITSLACGPLDLSLLGRELDDDVFAEIAAAGADTFGERGEYHTLVVDAPLFSHPLAAAAAGRFQSGGYWYLDFGVRPPDVVPVPSQS